MKHRIILLGFIILGLTSRNTKEQIQAIIEGKPVEGLGGTLISLVFGTWFVYFLYLRLERYRSKRAEKRQTNRDNGNK